MSENKERKEKSDKLFDKGMECYNNQQYKEALNYFEACIKFHKNDRAELFIRVCKNNIPEQDTKNNSSNNNNYSKNNSNNNKSNNYSYHKSYSSSTSSSSSNNSSNKKTTESTGPNKSYSTDNIGNSNEDKMCKELMKKKDYYDILNISKDATLEQIKKGYKKQAIRFHPDKNHSELATECFKKISEAYQCLSDPEKKSFYDKYGNEQEFKEKYFQRHHTYYQEEMDPFEAFNMFFGNGFFPGGAYHFRTGHDHHFNGENANINLNNNRKFLQFFPFIFLFLIYILPNLSFLFESKPLYQFTRTTLYNHKRKTSRNNVEFYVGDKFIQKYPKMADFKSLEPTIEKEYLDYLYEDCSSIINYKNRLQYYMAISYSNYEKQQYKRKIEQLNFSSCNKYNTLIKYIR